MHRIRVHKIAPFLLTNSVVRLDSKKVKNKKECWQKIALAAVKQCGRNSPTIEAPKTLDDYLKNKNKQNSTLVLYEKEGPKFSTLLENLKKSRHQSC